MKKSKTQLQKFANEELERISKIFAKAMMMVGEKYGNSLSHDEYMNKAEEIYCKLIAEEESDNLT